MFEEINYRLADESQYDPTQGYLEYMYDNMKFSCKVKGREETLKNFYVTAWSKLEISIIHINHWNFNVKMLSNEFQFHQSE